jgi:hypothetical protein
VPKSLNLVNRLVLLGVAWIGAHGCTHVSAVPSTPAASSSAVTSTSQSPITGSSSSRFPAAAPSGCTSTKVVLEVPAGDAPPPPVCLPPGGTLELHEGMLAVGAWKAITANPQVPMHVTEGMPNSSGPVTTVLTFPERGSYGLRIGSTSEFPDPEVSMQLKVLVR